MTVYLIGFNDLTGYIGFYRIDKEMEEIYKKHLSIYNEWRTFDETDFTGIRRYIKELKEVDPDLFIFDLEW